MLLTLIRHGKSTDMQGNLVQGPYSPLSENSISVLSEKAKNFDSRGFDAVYTSTYTRARQTAELLFDKEVIKVLDYVHESNMTPHLHGKSYDEVSSYWAMMPDSYKYDDDYAHGNDEVKGETFNEMISRTDKFVEFLITNHSDDHQIALVGHGHFFRVLIARVMRPEVFNYKMFSQFFRFFDLENGSITTIEINLETRRGVIREMSNWEIM